ncbi:M42 family metallopeptidase [uncultured Bacteroides sp.]|jgi:Cellulase M and related proteins|uniref:M42 family metallopeptidase n=1 Tax=uncultured Bacteroides sp. TaxID=162156 RepID=UPI002676CB76|nr:M20/M25/M40 family metallo-hydrolase [uncultured Bacteroides sp.]
MGLDKESADDMALLDSLSQALGVSGFEKEVCAYYLEKVTGYVDRHFFDVMGNAYGVISGAEKGHNIMIEAHADEIGFQILHIGENGYLYLRRNGGIDEQCIPGSQVVVVTRNGEHIPGVIGKKPVHLMTADDRKRTLELSQLWVDTGLEADEVKSRISVGDVAAVKPDWQWLGGNRISGKSLDNKLGVFVLVKVMRLLAGKRPVYNSVTGVATVQEEVGSRGAVVAGYNVRPDIAVTIDLDFATDVPDCPPNKYGKVELGGGVVIPLHVDCDVELSLQMEKIAQSEGIAYQMSAKQYATGGTNISRLQLVREGVRTVSLGIPCRYMHTPVEMCDMRDVNAAVRLLAHFCLQEN